MENENLTIKRIKELCKINSTSLTALCVEFTESRGNLSTWKKGNIRNDYLINIAKRLNVSTDYLLGLSDDPTPPDVKESQSDITLDDFEVALFGEVRELDDEDRAELLKNARRMNAVRKLGGQNPEDK